MVNMELNIALSIKILTHNSNTAPGLYCSFTRDCRAKTRPGIDSNQVCNFWWPTKSKVTVIHVGLELPGQNT